MKSNKEIRAAGSSRDADETTKKAVKLPPIKKTGKDRHTLYSSLDEDEDDGTMTGYRRRESILDYFDDENDDEEYGEEEDFTEDDYDGDA